MSTYEVIKKLCADRGINITTLEMELGFSRGSLGKLKHGIQIQADRATKVAEYFDVPVEYILTGEMPPFYYDERTAELAQRFYQRPDLALLFEAAEDASPEDVELTYQMLKALKAKEGKN